MRETPSPLQTQTAKILFYSKGYSRMILKTACLYFCLFFFYHPMTYRTWLFCIVFLFSILCSGSMMKDTRLAGTDIHLLQTARFTKSQLLAYMQDKYLHLKESNDIWDTLDFWPVFIDGIPGVLDVASPSATVDSLPFTIYSFETTLEFIQDVGDTVVQSNMPNIARSLASKKSLQDSLESRLSRKYLGPGKSLHSYPIPGIDVLTTLDSSVTITIWDSSYYVNTIVHHPNNILHLR